LIDIKRPMEMVDDGSAKVLSDLGHHGYEHYSTGMVDTVADGLLVRTGFWTVPDLASEIARAAAVTTVDTIQRPRHRWVRKSREATTGQSICRGKRVQSIFGGVEKIGSCLFHPFCS
jgi:hypothetical protein